jgi:hypothetical protein
MLANIPTKMPSVVNVISTFTGSILLIPLIMTGLE